MPWGLLIFIAGLVTYFVTEYDTLGAILMGLGIVFVLIGILFMIFTLRAVSKMGSTFDSRRW